MLASRLHFAPFYRCGRGTALKEEEIRMGGCDCVDRSGIETAER